MKHLAYTNYESIRIILLGPNNDAKILFKIHSGHAEVSTFATHMPALDYIVAMRAGYKTCFRLLINPNFKIHV